MPPEPSLQRLEHLDLHPMRTFLADEQMTSGRINVGIAAIGLMAVIGVVTGGAHPIVLVFAAAAGWALWRNYRRFRERTRHALAELGGPPPTVPRLDL